MEKFTVEMLAGMLVGIPVDSHIAAGILVDLWICPRVSSHMQIWQRRVSDLRLVFVEGPKPHRKDKVAFHLQRHRGKSETWISTIENFFTIVQMRPKNELCFCFNLKSRLFRKKQQCGSRKTEDF